MAKKGRRKIKKVKRNYLTKDGKKYKDGRRPPSKVRRKGIDQPRRAWFNTWVSDNFKFRDPPKNVTLQRQSDVQKNNAKFRAKSSHSKKPWSLNRLAWQASQHLNLTENKVRTKRLRRMPTLLFTQSVVRPANIKYMDQENFCEMIRGRSVQDKDADEDGFTFCSRCPYWWGRSLVVTAYGSNLTIINDDMYDHRMRVIYSYIGTRHITLKSDYKFVKHWYDEGHQITCHDWLGFRNLDESEVHMLVGHEDGCVFRIDLQITQIMNQFYPFGKAEDGEEPSKIAFVKVHKQTQIFVVVSEDGECKFFKFKDIRNKDEPVCLGSVDVKPEIRDVMWVGNTLVFMGKKEFFEPCVTAQELFDNREALEQEPGTWDFKITYKTKTKSKFVNFQQFHFPTPQEGCPEIFLVLNEDGIIEEHGYKKGLARTFDHEDLDVDVGWAMHPSGKCIAIGNEKGGVTYVDYQTEETLGKGPGRGSDNGTPRFLFWGGEYRDQLFSCSQKRVTRYHPPWTRFYDSLPSEPHVYYKHKVNYPFRYSSMDYSNINHNHRQNESEGGSIPQYIDLEMQAYRDKDFQKKKWSTIKRELEQHHMLDVAYNGNYGQREHKDWTNKKRAFIQEVKEIKAEFKRTKFTGRVENELKSEALLRDVRARDSSKAKKKGKKKISGKKKKAAKKKSSGKGKKKGKKKQ